ncbi:MAG: hypothetical protein A2Y66_00040 [Nitrospirae bacterium RBG_13_41_22]|nr:MAG: hypothetical protein A2Y66_00040 [Nitrospirae bacterium RBG_13_41_22]
MKYSDMSEAQKAAFRDILGTIIKIKSQEEQKYIHDGYRLLVLGNGAGTAILATFMGSLASHGSKISGLIIPLTLFTIGVVLAALTYVPLIAVSNQATINVTNQITDFFWIKKMLKRCKDMVLQKGGVLFSRFCWVDPSLYFVSVYICVCPC